MLLMSDDVLKSQKDVNCREVLVYSKWNTNQHMKSLDMFSFSTYFKY